VTLSQNLVLNTQRSKVYQ